MNKHNEHVAYNLKQLIKLIEDDFDVTRCDMSATHLASTHSTKITLQIELAKREPKTNPFGPGEREVRRPPDLPLPPLERR